MGLAGKTGHAGGRARRQEGWQAERGRQGGRQTDRQEGARAGGLAGRRAQARQAGWQAGTLARWQAGGEGWHAEGLAGRRGAEGCQAGRRAIRQAGGLVGRS